MDKVINFVRDGKGRLPPGFRFQPTDEEIVFEYLSSKVFSHPLPSSIIPEIDIFSFDPWDLPGDCEQDRYFFSNTEAKYASNWKAIGSDKQIICPEKLPLVGIKRTMAFYNGTSITHWIMHVYYIASSSNKDYNIGQKKKFPVTSKEGCLVHIGNWSLCHVEKRSEDDDISDADSCSASSSSFCSNSDHCNAFTEVSSRTVNTETSYKK